MEGDLIWGGKHTHQKTKQRERNEMRTTDADMC